MSKQQDKAKLTPKQERFVAEYLVDFNAKQAAIRAGYSEKTAEVQGSRLLRNAQVAIAVVKGKERQAAKVELTAEGNLEQIRRGSQFDIRELFDEAGNLKPISQLTAEQAAAIAGFEVVKRNLTTGDDAIDTVIKIKLVDRAKYVEMAGKYFKQFTDKAELTGKDGAPLPAGVTVKFVQART